MTGALGFFALFFDFIIDLFMGRGGTSVLRAAFIVYLLRIRKNILARLPRIEDSIQLRSNLPEPTGLGAR